MKRAGSDRGSASIWVLAVGLMVALLGLGCVAVGRAAIAAHQAQVAADMGALAGATNAILGAGTACAESARIVAANGAAQAACRLDGFDIVVTASVPLAAGPVRSTAMATARAGPMQASG